MIALRTSRIVALAGLVALVFGGAMVSSADAGCGGYGGVAAYGGHYGTGFLTGYNACYTPCINVCYKPCLVPVHNYVTKLVCQKYTYPTIAYDCCGCPKIVFQIGTKHVPVTQLVTSYVYQ